MLYEIIGIVRPGSIAEIKEIIHTSGQTILRRGGVIRSLANWGVFALPRPITHAQMRHTKGHYFVMRFDASSDAQMAVRSALAIDPRVIRCATVKLGDGKLATTSRFGEILWESAFKRGF